MTALPHRKAAPAGTLCGTFRALKNDKGDRHSASLMFRREPGKMGTQAPWRYGLQIFILGFVVNVFTAKMLDETNIKQPVFITVSQPFKGYPPPTHTAYLLIFLSCKANAREFDAKSGHGPHSPPPGAAPAKRRIFPVCDTVSLGSEPRQPTNQSLSSHT